jgi:hypothetical protein
MKANGHRIMSFMNGGQPREQQRANERLFALKTELERAEKEAAKDSALEPIPMKQEPKGGTADLRLGDNLARAMKRWARAKDVGLVPLAALLTALLAWYRSSQETVGPQDYDLTTYWPKRRQW